MLLTRAPLYWPPKGFSRSTCMWLSPPLTFALSQDQTLQLKTVSVCSRHLPAHGSSAPEGAPAPEELDTRRCSSVLAIPYEDLSSDG